MPFTNSHSDYGQVRGRETHAHKQDEVLVSRLLQYGHLLFELEHLSGIIQHKVFDGHFPMPVAFVHTADAAPAQGLLDVEMVIGDAPLVHDTVPMLLRGGRGRGREGRGRGNMIMAQIYILAINCTR